MKNLPKVGGVRAGIARYEDFSDSDLFFHNYFFHNVLLHSARYRPEPRQLSVDFSPRPRDQAVKPRPVTSLVAFGCGSGAEEAGAWAA